MPMPNKLHVPWSTVDPTMQHGGISGELGAFVAPDLGDNKSTQNRTLAGIFYDLCQWVAAISMHHESDSEGPPGKSLVMESLLVIQTISGDVICNTHTHAKRFFGFTHAIPPTNAFKVSAIRYPLRNSYADEFVHYGLGTLVEIAENSRNAHHKGIDPTSADIILYALYELKATVMKQYFAKEVAGEISSDELAKLYETINVPSPFFPDETTATPGGTSVADALKGVDVFKWVPNDADWTQFGRIIQKRFRPERILQPEGASPVTEDVRDENPAGGEAEISTSGGPGA